MRTTVTLDPDVEALVRKAMQDRGLSFKAILNEAVRAGLTVRSLSSPRKFRMKTYRMGYRPELPLDKAVSIAAAIEGEEIVRKLSVRK